MKTPALHFHFLTLFPETIPPWLTTSIVGRAHEAGLFAFETIQLRDFATDKHRSVDDAAYGGGGGMVFRIEPLVAAVEAVKGKIVAADPQAAVTTIYFSPAGRPLAQGVLDELTPAADGPARHLMLVCGHYEGVDQRFIDHWVDLEISLGDFVLTGGELPAIALADALIRQLPGALGHEAGPLVESFRLRSPDAKHTLLEYPHYTRPAEFRGLKVPDVLLGGNHGEVDRWRLEAATERTQSKRPDLIKYPHRSP